MTKLTFLTRATSSGDSRLWVEKEVLLARLTVGSCVVEKLCVCFMAGENALDCFNDGFEMLWLEGFY